MTSALTIASTAFGAGAGGGLGGMAAGLPSIVGAAVNPGTSGVSNWINLANKYGPYGALLANPGAGLSANQAYGQEATYAARAAEFEAQQMEVNAQITADEAARDASKIADNARRFAGEQAVAYASSGVTLEGSPLLVLDETRRKAQEEVDATYRRGQQISSALKMQAQMTREFGAFQASTAQSKGRSALLGSSAKGFADLFNNYIVRQRYGTQANYQGRIAAYAPTTWAGGTP